MKQTISIALLWLACGNAMPAQTSQPSRILLVAQTGAAENQQVTETDTTTLDALRERRALQIFLKLVQTQIVSAAEAMPADKYGFAPTDGEFKGVRSFGQQVKHLAATNHIWPLPP